MAPAYRSYVAHSAYNGRGVDGLSVTTAAGDVVVALWQHLTGTIQYFNWDDAAIPGYTSIHANCQYGVVYNPTPGSHHLDYYCDNGGNNLMMVFLLTGLTNTVLDSDFYAVDPPYPQTYGVTLSVVPGTILCTNVVMDAWNCGSPSTSFQSGETSLYSDGGYNGWYPVRGGYLTATSTSQQTSAYYNWTTGDSGYAGIASVALTPRTGASQAAWFM